MGRSRQAQYLGGYPGLDPGRRWRLLDRGRLVCKEDVISFHFHFPSRKKLDFEFKDIVEIRFPRDDSVRETLLFNLVQFLKELILLPNLDIKVWTGVLEIDFMTPRGSMCTCGFNVSGGFRFMRKSGRDICFGAENKSLSINNEIRTSRKQTGLSSAVIKRSF